MREPRDPIGWKPFFLLLTVCVLVHGRREFFSDHSNDPLVDVEQPADHPFFKPPVLSESTDINAPERQVVVISSQQDPTVQPYSPQILTKRTAPAAGGDGEAASKARNQAGSRSQSRAQAQAIAEDDEESGENDVGNSAFDEHEQAEANERNDQFKFNHQNNSRSGGYVLVHRPTDSLPNSNSSSQKLPPLTISGGLKYELPSCGGPFNEKCPAHADCFATKCRCHAGFDWNEKMGRCEDVNECDRQPNPCKSLPGVEVWCVNTPGNFSCCSPGAPPKEKACAGLEIITMPEANQPKPRPSEGSINFTSNSEFRGRLRMWKEWKNYTGGQLIIGRGHRPPPAGWGLELIGGRLVARFNESDVPEAEEEPPPPEELDVRDTLQISGETTTDERKNSGSPIDGNTEREGEALVSKNRVKITTTARKIPTTVLEEPLEFFLPSGMTREEPPASHPSALASPPPTEPEEMIAGLEIVGRLVNAQPPTIDGESNSQTSSPSVIDESTSIPSNTAANPRVIVDPQSKEDNPSIESSSTTPPLSSTPQFEAASTSQPPAESTTSRAPPADNGMEWVLEPDGTNEEEKNVAESARSTATRDSSTTSFEVRPTTRLPPSSTASSPAPTTKPRVNIEAEGIPTATPFSDDWVFKPEETPEEHSTPDADNHQQTTAEFEAPEQGLEITNRRSGSNDLPEVNLPPFPSFMPATQTESPPTDRSDAPLTIAAEKKSSGPDAIDVEGPKSTSEPFRASPTSTVDPRAEGSTPTTRSELLSTTPLSSASPVSGELSSTRREDDFRSTVSIERKEEGGSSTPRLELPATSSPASSNSTVASSTAADVVSSATRKVPTAAEETTTRGRDRTTLPPSSTVPADATSSLPSTFVPPKGNATTNRFVDESSIRPTSTPPVQSSSSMQTKKVNGEHNRSTAGTPSLLSTSSAFAPKPSASPPAPESKSEKTTSPAPNVEKPATSPAALSNGTSSVEGESTTAPTLPIDTSSPQSTRDAFPSSTPEARNEEETSRRTEELAASTRSTSGQSHRISTTTNTPLGTRSSSVRVPNADHESELRSSSALPATQGESGIRTSPPSFDRSSPFEPTASTPKITGDETKRTEEAIRTSAATPSPRPAVSTPEAAKEASVVPDLPSSSQPSRTTKIAEISSTPEPKRVDETTEKRAEEKAGARSRTPVSMTTSTTVTSPSEVRSTTPEATSSSTAARPTVSARISSTFSPPTPRESIPEEEEAEPTGFEDRSTYTTPQEVSKGKTSARFTPSSASATTSTSKAPPTFTKTSPQTTPMQPDVTFSSRIPSAERASTTNPPSEQPRSSLPGERRGAHQSTTSRSTTSGSSSSSATSSSARSTSSAPTGSSLPMTRAAEKVAEEESPTTSSPSARSTSRLSTSPQGIDSKTTTIDGEQKTNPAPMDSTSISSSTPAAPRKTPEHQTTPSGDRSESTMVSNPSPSTPPSIRSSLPGEIEAIGSSTASSPPLSTSRLPTSSLPVDSNRTESEEFERPSQPEDLQTTLSPLLTRETYATTGEAIERTRAEAETKKTTPIAPRVSTQTVEFTASTTQRDEPRSSTPTVSTTKQPLSVVPVEKRTTNAEILIESSTRPPIQSPPTDSTSSPVSSRSTKPKIVEEEAIQMTESSKAPAASRTAGAVRHSTATSVPDVQKTTSTPPSRSSAPTEDTRSPAEATSSASPSTPSTERSEMGSQSPPSRRPTTQKADEPETSRRLQTTTSSLPPTTPAAPRAEGSDQTTTRARESPESTGGRSSAATASSISRLFDRSSITASSLRPTTPPIEDRTTAQGEEMETAGGTSSTLPITGQSELRAEESTKTRLTTRKPPTSRAERTGRPEGAEITIERVESTRLRPIEKDGNERFEKTSAPRQLPDEISTRKETDGDVRRETTAAGNRLRSSAEPSSTTNSSRSPPISSAASEPGPKSSPRLLASSSFPPSEMRTESTNEQTHSTRPSTSSSEVQRTTAARTGETTVSPFSSPPTSRSVPLRSSSTASTPSSGVNVEEDEKNVTQKTATTKKAAEQHGFSSSPSPTTAVPESSTMSSTSRESRQKEVGSTTESPSITESQPLPSESAREDRTTQSPVVTKKWTAEATARSTSSTKKSVDSRPPAPEVATSAHRSTTLDSALPSSTATSTLVLPPSTETPIVSSELTLDRDVSTPTQGGSPVSTTESSRQEARLSTEPPASTVGDGETQSPSYRPSFTPTSDAGEKGVQKTSIVATPPPSSIQPPNSEASSSDSTLSSSPSPTEQPQESSSTSSMPPTQSGMIERVSSSLSPSSTQEVTTGQKEKQQLLDRSTIPVRGTPENDGRVSTDAFWSRFTSSTPLAHKASENPRPVEDGRPKSGEDVNAGTTRVFDVSTRSPSPANGSSSATPPSPIRTPTTDRKSPSVTSTTRSTTRATEEKTPTIQPKMTNAKPTTPADEQQSTRMPSRLPPSDGHTSEEKTTIIPPTTRIEEELPEITGSSHPPDRTDDRRTSTRPAATQKRGGAEGRTSTSSPLHQSTKPMSAEREAGASNPKLTTSFPHSTAEAKRAESERSTATTPSTSAAPNSRERPAVEQKSTAIPESSTSTRGRTAEAERAATQAGGEKQVASSTTPSETTSSPVERSSSALRSTSIPQLQSTAFTRSGEERPSSSSSPHFPETTRLADEESRLAAKGIASSSSGSGRLFSTTSRLPSTSRSTAGDLIERKTTLEMPALTTEAVRSFSPSAPTSTPEDVKTASTESAEARSSTFSSTTSRRFASTTSFASASVRSGWTATSESRAEKRRTTSGFVPKGNKGFTKLQYQNRIEIDEMSAERMPDDSARPASNSPFDSNSPWDFQPEASTSQFGLMLTFQQKGGWNEPSPVVDFTRGPALQTPAPQEHGLEINAKGGRQIEIEGDEREEASENEAHANRKTAIQSGTRGGEEGGKINGEGESGKTSTEAGRTKSPENLGRRQEEEQGEAERGATEDGGEGEESSTRPSVTHVVKTIHRMLNGTLIYGRTLQPPTTAGELGIEISGKSHNPPTESTEQQHGLEISGKDLTPLPNTTPGFGLAIESVTKPPPNENEASASSTPTSSPPLIITDESDHQKTEEQPGDQLATSTPSLTEETTSSRPLLGPTETSPRLEATSPTPDGVEQTAAPESAPSTPSESIAEFETTPGSSPDSPTTRENDQPEASTENPSIPSATGSASSSPELPVSSTPMQPEESPNSSGSTTPPVESTSAGESSTQEASTQSSTSSPSSPAAPSSAVPEVEDRSTPTPDQPHDRLPTETTLSSATEESTMTPLVLNSRLLPQTTPERPPSKETTRAPEGESTTSSLAPSEPTDLQTAEKIPDVTKSPWSVRKHSGATGTPTSPPLEETTVISLLSPLPRAEESTNKPTKSSSSSTSPRTEPSSTSPSPTPIQKEAEESTSTPAEATSTSPSPSTRTEESSTLLATTSLPRVSTTPEEELPETTDNEVRSTYTTPRGMREETALGQTETASTSPPPEGSSSPKVPTTGIPFESASTPHSPTSELPLEVQTSPKAVPETSGPSVRVQEATSTPDVPSPSIEQSPPSSASSPAAPAELPASSSPAPAQTTRELVVETTSTTPESPPAAVGSSATSLPVQQTEESTAPESPSTQTEAPVSSETPGGSPLPTAPPQEPSSSPPPTVGTQQPKIEERVVENKTTTPTPEIAETSPEASETPVRNVQTAAPRAESTTTVEIRAERTTPSAAPTDTATVEIRKVSPQQPTITERPTHLEIDGDDGQNEEREREQAISTSPVDQTTQKSEIRTERPAQPSPLPTNVPEAEEVEPATTPKREEQPATTLAPKVEEETSVESSQTTSLSSSPTAPPSSEQPPVESTRREAETPRPEATTLRIEEEMRATEQPDFVLTGKPAAEETPTQQPQTSTETPISSASTIAPAQPTSGSPLPEVESERSNPTEPTERTREPAEVSTAEPVSTSEKPIEPSSSTSPPSSEAIHTDATPTSSQAVHTEGTTQLVSTIEAERTTETVAPSSQTTDRSQPPTTQSSTTETSPDSSSISIPTVPDVRESSSPPAQEESSASSHAMPDVHESSSPVTKEESPTSPPTTPENHESSTPPAREETPTTSPTPERPSSVAFNGKTIDSASPPTSSETSAPLDVTIGSRYITMPRSRVSIRTTTPSNEPTETSTEPKGPRCVSSDECGLDARCDRSAGICRCRSGFRGEPKSAEGCIDVNECEKPGICNPTSICINHIGGFSCQCPIGYRKTPDGSCTDIDECQERSGNGTLCDPDADCLNAEGSYSCSCRTNWTGDGYTCFEAAKRRCTQEEWDISGCGKSHLCLVDTQGRWECEKCRHGFHMADGVCVDTNECASKRTNLCDANAACINSIGGYQCSCLDGYEGDGFSCVDVDECSKQSCHALATCTNLPGSFECSCPDGWTGNARFECVNPSDNVCQIKNGICSSVNGSSCLSVTMDSEWASFCECDEGYRWNTTTRQCDDIDECLEARFHCNSTTSACVNLLGSYSCQCYPGFEGIGGICVDLDECDRGIHGCHPNAECVNHVGSFSCKCAAGFKGDGRRCSSINVAEKDALLCTEDWVNYCLAFNKTCFVDEEEILQCGGCLHGFQPTEGKCLPVEEAGNCEDPAKNDCDPNAECINVHPGSHKCRCKSGWIGDGHRCDDVDECSMNPCSKDKKCRNTNGGFTCEPDVVSDEDRRPTSDGIPDQTDSVSPRTASPVSPTSSELSTPPTQPLSTQMQPEVHPPSASPSSTSSAPIQTKEPIRSEGPTLPPVTPDATESPTPGPTRLPTSISSPQSRESKPSESASSSPIPASTESSKPNVDSTTPAPSCHEFANWNPRTGCVCRPGYVGDGRLMCTRVWEETRQPESGATQSPAEHPTECATYCAPNSECVNGACRCVAGYTPDLNGMCQDVDECRTEAAKCDPAAYCVNTAGSFECRCSDGLPQNERGCDREESKMEGFQLRCESNGMRLMFNNQTAPFVGRAFVLGQSQNPLCSSDFPATPAAAPPQSFFVSISDCVMDLEPNETLGTTVVLQPHRTFITSRAAAYRLRCTYPLGSKAAMSRVNVSEPEPPEQTYQTDIQPRCEFGVTNLHNEGVNKAVVGQVLKLVLSVQPNRTYGVAPLNCFAMNVETKERHRLTDEFGCPADRDLFAGWQRVSASRLQATFRTFKWPECGKVRFECDCAPCVGACVDADCNEGHYRKRRMSARFRRQQMADEKAAWLKNLGERPAIAFSPVVDVREHSNSLEVERTVDSWNPFVNEVDSDEEQTAIETTDGFSCLDSGWLMAAVLAAFAVGFVVVWCELRRSRRSKKSAFVRDPSCRSTSSYIHFQ